MAVIELGGIDILVNNAAHQASFKHIDDISNEERERTFRVNIHAKFYLTKAAVAHMKPGSAIINTASVNSDQPNPTLLAYATTKGAIQISRPDWHRCRRRRDSCQCRGARADLDAADPLDPSGAVCVDRSASRCR